MAAHEVDSARPKRKWRAIPPRNPLAPARRSGRPKRVNRFLAWVFSASMLAAAAALAAGAYWGYRQMQPRPLFTSADVNAEDAAVPATTAGGATGAPN